MTSAELGEIIAEKMYAPTEEDKGITGGSISELVMLYERVLKKHEVEETDEVSRTRFTGNIMNATSILMISETGWKEISEEKNRFTSASQILSGIDTLGYIFGAKSLDRRRSCEREKNFPSDNIQLVVRTLTPDSNIKECFSFDYGSVCLPPTVENLQGKEVCTVNVATTFR